MTTTLLSNNDLSWILIAGISIVGWRLTVGDSLAGRVLRIVTTIMLAGIALKAMHTGNTVVGGRVMDQEAFTMEGLKALACVLAASFLWIWKVGGQASEIFTQMLDSTDNRPVDLNTNGNLDRLASLANARRKSRAIRLARKMKRSGQYSAAAMDTMIARLS
jgi:hypothetical protein